ncbi:NADH-quinone oxidoreductase subunit A [Candidatus Erwinia haradaeae]|uniref:NADH-quinone oxidoreductase subunit A n=1 Tax=Candidatus Erwinia haradaeae TaxID=1922217 RepID=A0A451D798_9GAMM|nr:NADH-quinone oxidoreductase subunit A [Candidatus Erwinia haradaeae]VFP81731.1 NADH-quinone oxidoreductase subunit A [Candidatus Erwinia haradaeae]
MQQSITEFTYNWSFCVFIFSSIFLCFIMLLVSWFLGSTLRGRYTNTPFESGIASVRGRKLRVSAKFYLVAMFFVIFDVEALYLYAWSVSIRESGWIGFIEASLFILVLIISLFYLIRNRALDWSPTSRNVKIVYTTISHVKKKHNVKVKNGLYFDSSQPTERK